MWACLDSFKWYWNNFWNKYLHQTKDSLSTTYKIGQNLPKFQDNSFILIWEFQEVSLHRTNVLGIRKQFYIGHNSRLYLCFWISKSIKRVDGTHLWAQFSPSPPLLLQLRRTDLESAGNFLQEKGCEPFGARRYNKSLLALGLKTI